LSRNLLPQMGKRRTISIDFGRNASELMNGTSAFACDAQRGVELPRAERKGKARQSSR
jgi:hypothetical protein